MVYVILNEEAKVVVTSGELEGTDTKYRSLFLYLFHCVLSHIQSKEGDTSFDYVTQASGEPVLYTNTCRFVFQGITITYEEVYRMEHVRIGVWDTFSTYTVSAEDANTGYSNACSPEELQGLVIDALMLNGNVGKEE